MSDTGAEELTYRANPRAVLLYNVKKAFAILLYIGMGALVVWLVGPGLASERSPGLEYWTTLALVVAAFVVLTFLIVIAWNQRLASIENGQITWPFPFLRKSGVRTRYVRIEEITRAEVSVNNAGRRSAELTLLDGTRLILPETVFGEKGPRILEALERQVNGPAAGGAEMRNR